MTELQILHNLDYHAISVTVDKSTSGTVVENGRKILKAGAILGGVSASVFTDRKQKVAQTTPAGETVDGILQHDVDVTDQDAVVSMIYQGTVRSDRVAGYEATLDAKLPQIKFVNGI